MCNCWATQYFLFTWCILWFEEGGGGEERGQCTWRGFQAIWPAATSCAGRSGCWGPCAFLARLNSTGILPPNAGRSSVSQTHFHAHSAISHSWIIFILISHWSHIACHGNWNKIKVSLCQFHGLLIKCSTTILSFYIQSINHMIISFYKQLINKLL